MLSNNTNKITWVGVTIGIVAALGIGTMTMFPSALGDVKSTVVKTVDKFSGSGTSASATITVVDNNPLSLSVNVPYVKLPNGKFITGTFGNSATVDGKTYTVPMTSDFSNFYDKYGQDFDASDGINLSNGLSFNSPSMLEAYKYSSGFGETLFESDANKTPENSISGNSVLNPSTGKIEMSNADINKSVDIQSQDISSVVGSSNEYESQPQDFDVSLQREYSLDTSDDNLNLAKKLYPNFDFDSNQLYFVNQGSNLHVHYYEVAPKVTN